MGEAMIIRAGGGYNSNGGSENNIVGWKPKSEVITANGYYVVPKAKDQEFHIRLFGGGGGCVNGLCYRSDDIVAMGGGGGGNMNNNTFILNLADSIPVTIGAGGNLGKNGGTTSFGTYLSATGGSIGKCYEWGRISGGNGGSGGGAYEFYSVVRDTGSISESGSNMQGGNATYGGGGGSRGKKGTYGGNGGTQFVDAKNGTNTTKMNGLDFVGDGKAGIYNSKAEFPTDGCGWGGYGGNGGRSYNRRITGGGGGYGASGGDGYVSVSTSYDPGSSVTWFASYTHGGAGGGGGYGGKGGNGYSSSTVCRGGYGGGYGPENYGRGGGSEYNNGKAGIIIITYQEPIYA